MQYLLVSCAAGIAVRVSFAYNTMGLILLLYAERFQGVQYVMRGKVHLFSR